MTGPEDRLRELLAESGIVGGGAEQLVSRLSALEGYVDDAPPEPSPQLAALMAGTAKAAVVAPLTRRRGRLLMASAVAVGAVGAGGIAAAANELPAPAQEVVAKLSERYLPFNLPHPRTPAAEDPADNSPEDPVLPPSSPAWGSDDEPPRRERLGGEPTTAPSEPASPRPSRSTGPTPSSTPSPVGPTPTVPEESIVPSEPTEPTEDPTAIEGDGVASGDGTGGTGSTDSTESAPAEQTDGGGTVTAEEPPSSPSPSSRPSPTTSSRRADPPTHAEPGRRGKAKGHGTAVWSDS